VKTTIDGPNQGKVATRDGESRFSPALPHQKNTGNVSKYRKCIQIKKMYPNK